MRLHVLGGEGGGEASGASTLEPNASKHGQSRSYLPSRNMQYEGRPNHRVQVHAVWVALLAFASATVGLAGSTASGPRYVCPPGSPSWCRHISDELIVALRVESAACIQGDESSGRGRPITPKREWRKILHVVVVDLSPITIRPADNRCWFRRTCWGLLCSSTHGGGGTVREGGSRGDKRA
jgi:hypothetical protein